MKKALLLLAGLLAAVGGYFFYKNMTSESASLADFIPDKTLLLVESNSIQKTNFNKAFQRVLPVAEAKKQLELLRKIGFNKTEISDFLGDKNLLFALLPEGKDNLQFVTFAPIRGEDRPFVEKLREMSFKTEGMRGIRHTTRGYKIYEIIDASSKSVLSYLLEDNHLIFSRSSLLIEDIVLNRKNLWAKNLNLESKSDTLQTFLHFNAKAISHFSSYSLQYGQEFSTFLAGLLPESNHLEIHKFAKQKAVNGVSVEKIDTENSFWKVFENQTPEKISAAGLIPNSSAMVLHFSLSNPFLMGEAIGKLQESDKKISQLKEMANTRFGVDFKSIFEKTGKEIILLGMENYEGNGSKRILLIREASENQLYRAFTNISRKVAASENRRDFSERYGSFNVSTLGLKNFPGLLFGGLGADFEESYFTNYNGYVVIANDLSTLQDYLLSISKGDVWSNSYKNQSILKSCKAANITFVFNPVKGWEGTSAAFTSKWQQKLAKFKETDAGSQNLIFQRNLENNTLSSQITWLNESSKIRESDFSNTLVMLNNTNIRAASNPFFLANPVSHLIETLVQGEDSTLYLLKYGKKIWSKKLGELIKSDFKPVQFFDDKRQQYICSGRSRIYVLARNEKGFEIRTSKPHHINNLTNFAVFNNGAEQSNVSFIASDGNNYELDKAGMTCKKITARGSSKYLFPFPMVMLNNTEFAILLDENGKLNAVNQSGKSAAGFPLNLQSHFRNPLLLEKAGNSLSIRAIGDKTGNLFKIGLSGKIEEKKQLFRPVNVSDFQFTADEKGIEWFIMRNNGKNVTILDKSENEICTIKDLGFGEKEFHFYNLGANIKVFCISTDNEHRLYDMGGNKIGDRAITSKYPPQITYSESYQKLLITAVGPEAIETWSVKMK
ncbi:hypothetical protein SAMN04515674_109101 [Pseudarcicella hirudinis]|uniref:Uncharacterized protein n=2 Tax=Pseudarcicella hirudinis TaxID=1079859 RepID=A0A1I5VGI8_9BACT|nr:hypothetical protein [Pseudarcicella hirudinis]SFQ06531.1 hypothetical protein SAMN04515674_109101 [Pseudarcicella hirudinis]